MTYRNPLAKHAGSMRDPDPEAARRAAAAAWHEHGIVLINRDWLGAWDWKQAEILAEKLHGKRGGTR